MGGSGDNGAYEAKTQEIENKKQAARDRLNYMFGIGGGGAGTKVDRNQFVRSAKTPQEVAAAAGAPVDWAALQTRNNAMLRGGVDALPTSPTPEAAPAAQTYDEAGNPIQNYTYFDKAAYDEAQAKADAEATGSNPNKGARDQLYQTVRDSAFNAGRRRLDESNVDAARKLKFELFAKGLNGGSEDVNQNALRERTYKQGIVDLGGKADAAKADFRQGDESTRLNLLQSIDSGMDQGTALSSAISQMGVNSDKAAAGAIGTNLGDLFNTGSEFYNQSQYAKGRQAGMYGWNGMFPSRPTGGASVSPGAANGVTTWTGG